MNSQVSDANRPSESEQTRLQVDAQIEQIIKQYHNVNQVWIHISEDRLRLCLGRHIGQAIAKGAWIAPASLLVAILLTMVTATFHDALLLSASAWQILFTALALVTVAWLIQAFLKTRKKGLIVDNEVIDEILREVKGSDIE